MHTVTVYRVGYRELESMKIGIFSQEDQDRDSAEQALVPKLNSSRIVVPTKLPGLLQNKDIDGVEIYLIIIITFYSNHFFGL